VITTTDFWKKVSNREYRAAFATTQFKRLVPLQIQTLRRQRAWSQAELARNANLTQGVISRAEDQDYGNLTINTILTIAEGFDVAFVGRFVPFSELYKWYDNLNAETMRVLSFDEENQAMSAGVEDDSDLMVAVQGNSIGDAKYGNVIDFESRQGLGGTQEPSGCGLESMQRTLKRDGGLAHGNFSSLAS
jgi:transcriptional regulator with XRE-family HTH domain